MALNIEQVRWAYWNLPDAGAIGRPLTREERFALAEREFVRLCEVSGRCPKAEGRGEHGSLIGGKDKPMRIHYGAGPFESYAPVVLAPMAWFSHLSDVGEEGSQDPAHLRLRGAIASHMAGVPELSRPTGAALRAAFLAEAPSELEKRWLGLILSGASVRELGQIGFAEGFTPRVFARAAHASGTISHRVANWLNQYSAKRGEVRL